MILFDVQQNKIRCAALLLLTCISYRHDSLAAQNFVAAPQPPVASHVARKNRKQKHEPVKADTGIDLLKEAYLALSRGHLNLAEEKYLAYLARRPHEKDALLGLAVTYQRTLQNDSAARLYRQVLNEDMSNAAAAAGLISLSAEADPVAAESQLKELIEVKPAAPELHYALGGVLAEQKRLGEAEQAFYRAYSLAPDNALYAYDLAVSLDRLHQSDAAIPYYEQALSLSQSDDAMLDLNAVGRRIRELKNSHQQSLNQ